MKAWITRDRNGILSIFNAKPIRNKDLGYWHVGEIKIGYFCWGLSPNDIPNINPQWEDDEPIEVEIKIEKI